MSSILGSSEPEVELFFVFLKKQSLMMDIIEFLSVVEFREQLLMRTKLAVMLTFGVVQDWVIFLYDCVVCGMGMCLLGWICSLIVRSGYRVNQLNGNNGEATNGDDLDRGQLDNAAQFPPLDTKDKRSSRGQHHSKKRAIGREGSNNENAGRRMSDKGKGDKKEPIQVKKERPSEKVICMGIEEPFGWDGKECYFKRGFNDCTNKGGKVFKRLCANSLLNKVKTSGLGFIEVFTDVNETDDLRLVTVLKSPWSHERVDTTFVHEGMRFEPSLYYVFQPALEMLKKKFSSTLISESMVNGMLAALNREFVTPDEMCLLPTISYYVHASHKKNFLISRTNVSRTKVVTMDRESEKYMSVLNLARNNECVVRFDSIDCSVKDKYPGRDDCLVTRFNDGERTCWSGNIETQYSADDPTSYPHFLYSEEDANSGKYYRSQFLSFDSNDTQPFVTYSVNAHNASKALKRMAGARETHKYDHYLSSLQYSAFAEVLNRSYGGKEFYDSNRDFFSIGRLEPRFKNDLFSKWIVGPHKWDKQLLVESEVLFEDTLNRRVTYLDPYQERPKAGVVPVFNSTQELLRRMEIEGMGVNEKLYSGELAFNTYSAWASSLYATEWDDAAEMRDWMHWEHDGLPVYQGGAYELNLVHERMAVGFATLNGNHRLGKVQAYAEDHPNWIYLEGWQRYLTFLDCESDRSWHASISHVKKKLREMFVSSEVVHTPTDIMVKAVNAKVKKEFAKYGKVPRLFVTYDAGCMYANELPEYSKICLDGTYSGVCNGVTTEVCIFAKPGSNKLKTELTNAVSAMGRKNFLNILIYSDDSVWSGNVNGVDFAFNVDISSCDSGNKAGVFGLVYILLSNFRQDLALGLVSQCAKTIHLVNPECKEERMEVEMATYFEGSGTVLTTILNHVAMYMVGQVATVLFGQRRQLLRDWTDVKKLIMECGVLFGHVLSVEECIEGSSFCPEKIQFLKRSPIMTVDGDYIPCMNYGTIFRSFGSVEGDMVAEMVGLEPKDFSAMGWDERWDLFGSRVVAGLINEPSSIVLQALRQRYPLTPKRFDTWSDVTFGNERLQIGGFEMTGVSEGGKVTLDNMSLTRRYDTSVQEMEMLASQILASKFGDVFPSAAVGAFFKIDYGLGSY